MPICYLDRKTISLFAWQHSSLRSGRQMHKGDRHRRQFVISYGRDESVPAVHSETGVFVSAVADGMVAR